MKHKKSHSKIVRTINPTYLAWADAGTLDRHIASKATRKGHKHVHNPAALPSGQRAVNKKKLVPAAYRTMTKFDGRIEALSLRNKRRIKSGG